MDHYKLWYKAVLRRTNNIVMIVYSHSTKFDLHHLHYTISIYVPKVVFYWDQPFLVGWVFSCSIGEKLFSVGLVDNLFRPASNQVETVEKAFA